MYSNTSNEALQVINESKPDVVVMDLKMPVKNGLSAIEEIKKSDPEVPILVLTSFPDDEMVISTIQLGANGAMLKDSPLEQLLNSIRDVVHGQSPLHPSVAHRLMLKIQQSAVPATTKSVLTTREIEVLKCMAHSFVFRISTI